MRRPLVLAACLAAATAGCGAEDGGAPEKTVTVERGQAARVVAHEYRFDPSGVVVAGPVRLRLDNEGSLAHNLRVLEGDRDLGGTPTFQGGSRGATLKLAPGNYRMVCTVGDHAELGMKGTLRVRARSN
jgi:plastocyanin